MNDDTDDSGGVIFEGPFDPDAQATVTDFIDYTEYLPSDLIRSLTLIRGLDETYLDATQKVHELTTIYGRLPELPVESRRNPQELREQISHHLNRALNAREASHAEACRIYDVVDRHYDRLGNIKRKLEALPKPASRDPTPPAMRSKGGRKTNKGATRITLRVDGHGTDRTGAPKSRNRRSMVSGLHPDSPIASTEQSDNEAPKVRSRRGGPVLNTGLEPVVRPKKDRRRARPRPPGPGTNVHSSIAGISTSNALALLKPPPEDAKLGSEDLPWLRLTDWEMTKLRKKMKKNAIWQPSEIMINRELANGGRGWEGYRAAKAKALAAGEELIDCDDIENTYVPGKLIRKSEATADMSAAEEIKTSNRGMILNEAKRLKRENLAREQEAASAAAAAAAEAELAAKRLSDIGSTFKRLFSTSGETSHVATTETINSNGAVAPSTVKSRSKATRKRKAEDNSLLERAELSEPLSKRQNTGKPQILEVTGDITEGPGAFLEDTKIPDRSRSRSKAQQVASTSPQQTRAPSTTSQASASREQISTTVISNVNGATTRTPSVTRPSSRRRSEAAPSTEPGSAVNTALAGVSREHLRRASVTPATKTPAPETGVATAGSTTSARRKKRPAPGPVSSTGEGGATLSHGKRKSKPKKRAPGKETIKGEDYRIDEDGVLEKIDPNEPRYCLCKDVSFGTMINCENPDCEGEWFHLECVGLQEPPSRRAKWFCPECRVKLKKAPDGIERVGGGRR